MEFIKEVYELSFIHRYLNDFMSLGLFWVVVVILFNIVIIRDILTEDNPLYQEIFWISVSISIVFPNLYLKLLFISRDYINPELFDFLKDVEIVMLGYGILLTPLVFICLYCLYFIFWIVKNIFYKKGSNVE